MDHMRRTDFTRLLVIRMRKVESVMQWPQSQSSDDMLMSRERDPYRIPRAGWEIAPTAGLASIDLNGNHGALTGGEFIGESTVGGMLVFATYQALLTAFRTEAMRKRGEINRSTQVQAILASVWETTKQGAAVSAVLSVVLLVFPWLGFPLSMIGIVGLGKASIDLVHAFWDGLSEEQRLDLQRAAFDAGVSLNQLLGGAAPGAQPA